MSYTVGEVTSTRLKRREITVNYSLTVVRHLGRTEKTSDNIKGEQQDKLDVFVATAVRLITACKGNERKWRNSRQLDIWIRPVVRI